MQRTNLRNGSRSPTLRTSLQGKSLGCCSPGEATIPVSKVCLSHANPAPKIRGWETEVLGQMQATTEVKKSLEFNYNDGISRIYGGTQGRQERGISCHKNLQGSALYIILKATRSGILQHREPRSPQLNFAGNTDRLRGGECPGQADARRPESGVDSEAMSYLAGALKEPLQGPGKA